MVIISTRFPADATKRYSHEVDFNTWKDRLHIYALDLRFLKDVEMFCDHISRTYKQLDILIQNAAQTIRRPTSFYKHLLQYESSTDLSYKSLIHFWDQCQHPEIQEGLTDSGLNSGKAIMPQVTGVGLIAKSALSSQLRFHPEDNQSYGDKYFPLNCYDEDHQQLDLRPVNSWILEADQVDTAELIEVNLINSISPFVILNKLTPLLKRSTADGGFGWIILVSAMEGKFNRFKTTHHPHTNCAKASLNMLVRTSAPYYKKFRLLLNAVDTGWVTEEEPLPLKLSRERPFHTPIDCVDGAARILHPIFQTINDNVANYGRFLKDYRFTSW